MHAENLMLLFNDWNAANQRARRAYYELRDEQDSKPAKHERPLPNLCGNGIHAMTERNTRPDGKCVSCFHRKMRRAMVRYRNREKML